MKILHIITRLDCGGSASDTIFTVESLRNHDFQTALAFGATHDPDGSIWRALADRQIQFFYLPSLLRNPSPARDLAALIGIYRLLRKEQFDLIHTHTSKAGALGRLAAHWRGIPAVHTPHGHIFYGYFRPQVTACYVRVERWVARYAARIISLTDDETRESLERGIGRPEQYVTIPSGVPLAFFRDIPRNLGTDFRSTFGIPADAFMFLSVGRLVAIKGFDILLQAFARADFSAGGGMTEGQEGKKVFLVIVGEGAERQALEALAGQLGIAGRVRFAGELRDIRGALSAADAFVLASRNEGLGSVFIEAMAAGLACIGTAVGGVPSLIRDRHTGLLAPAEDPVALARALSEIALNDELRRTLAKNAAASISPKYDREGMVERIAALYREVLGR
ncbi:MAG: glycosyltransferase [Lentisphaerae bacterium]|nr:glycosyltransferase [Lentisphaerota bacterium]